MLYSTVEIRPDSQGAYHVNFEDLEGDRVPYEGVPILFSPLGFLHYPTEWGRECGLEVLKEKLLVDCQTRIDNMLEAKKRISKIQL